MSAPHVPYRLELAVEVPGTPEQVWHALATARGLSSWFLPTTLEARSGGTCVVRVTTSGFGTGADWEQEWWQDMGASWRPSFDVLRLYLAHFPGRTAVQLEVTAVVPGAVDEVWRALLAEVDGPVAVGGGLTLRDLRGSSTSCSPRSSATGSAGASPSGT